MTELLATKKGDVSGKLTVWGGRRCAFAADVLCLLLYILLNMLEFHSQWVRRDCAVTTSGGLQVGRRAQHWTRIAAFTDRN